MNRKVEVFNLWKSLHQNYGQIILSRILNILGLCQFQIESKSARSIPVYFIIGLSVAAFAFETTTNINMLLTGATSNQGTTIMNVVDAWRYLFKTMAAMVVLITFWRKSVALTNITNEINNFNELPARNSKGIGKKCSRLAGLVVVVFVLYLSGMTVTRVVDIILKPRPWPTGFLGMTSLQIEAFALFTRNYTEAIRLLCSGYLGVVLTEFRDGPGAECRSILGRPLSLFLVR
jgi:hypothetical protein